MYMRLAASRIDVVADVQWSGDARERAERRGSAAARCRMCLGTLCMTVRCNRLLYRTTEIREYARRLFNRQPSLILASGF